MTVREHLENAVASLAGQPELLAHALNELHGPSMPPIAAHAWDVFGLLHRTRTMSQAGPNAIAYTEIKAYMDVTQDGLTPLDVRLVREADDAMALAFHHRTAQ